LLPDFGSNPALKSCHPEGGSGESFLLSPAIRTIFPGSGLFNGSQFPKTRLIGTWPTISAWQRARTAKASTGRHNRLCTGGWEICLENLGYFGNGYS
jgi:hypothetical protein